jgi:hypothetical protein
VHLPFALLQQERATAAAIAGHASDLLRLVDPGQRKGAIQLGQDRDPTSSQEFDELLRLAATALHSILAAELLDA